MKNKSNIGVDIGIFLLYYVVNYMLNRRKL